MQNRLTLHGWNTDTHNAQHQVVNNLIYKAKTLLVFMQTTPEVRLIAASFTILYEGR